MRSILLVTLDEIVLYCKSYFMGWKSLMAGGHGASKSRIDLETAVELDG